jgi:hypothetical protein
MRLYHSRKSNHIGGAAGLVFKVSKLRSARTVNVMLGHPAKLEFPSLSVLSRRTQTIETLKTRPAAPQ